MEGNGTTRPDEPDHLRDDPLWFWHVDEDQARRREVERCPGKTCAARIGLKDFDVRQAAGGDELPGAVHLLVTPLHTDDPARGADARGEQTEATPGATADLDDSPAVTHSDLVKQPR